MVDWTHVLVAIVVGLPATIAAISAAWQSYRNSTKIDTNTAITIKGSAAAVNNAKVAADTASEAKDAADNLAKQLNGALDDRITKIVKKHMDPLLANMNKIETTLKEMSSKLGN